MRQGRFTTPSSATPLLQSLERPAAMASAAPSMAEAQAALDAASSAASALCSTSLAVGFFLLWPGAAGAPVPPPRDLVILASLSVKCMMEKSM